MAGHRAPDPGGLTKTALGDADGAVHDAQSKRRVLANPAAAG